MKGDDWKEGLGWGIFYISLVGGLSVWICCGARDAGLRAAREKQEEAEYAKTDVLRKAYLERSRPYEKYIGDYVAIGKGFNQRPEARLDIEVGTLEDQSMRFTWSEKGRAPDGSPIGEPTKKIEGTWNEANDKITFSGPGRAAVTVNSEVQFSGDGAVLILWVDPFTFRPSAVPTIWVAATSGGY